MSVKMIEGYENAAAAVSAATTQLEDAQNALLALARMKNKGFLPPGIREGFPKAIEVLDQLFAALSAAQNE